MMRFWSVKQIVSRVVEMPNLLCGLSRQISTTCSLFAAPMKRKKKIDPVMLKLRVDRKLKKLEKAIKILKRTKKQYKPLVEYQLTPEILKTVDVRKRIDLEDLDKVLKDFENLAPIWSAFQREKLWQEYQSLEKIMTAQERAMKLLRLESEELYQKAVEIDEQLIPFADNLALKETPKIDGYQPADGQKTDVTKQWAM